MKIQIAISMTALLAAAGQTRAQSPIDRLDDALTFSKFHDEVRTRISGTLDLEAYHFDQPTPGLIDAEGHNLINPRLTLFLDSQIGAHLYIFAQARVDRGFDPSSGPAEARADEYAIRYTPWSDGRLNLQVGKFSTVVGNYNMRHLSWENPFITAPLPYEHVSAISDTEPPASSAAFVAKVPTASYEENPIIWGPVYATGASASAKFDKVDLAVEIKNAALSAHPRTWDATDTGFEHPTVSARAGFRPNEAWNFGASVSEGAYLRPEARPLLPPGRSLDDFHQQTIAQDASFAWRHWQLWAEAFESRFQVPNVGDADAFGYYFEGKYKFAPQFFAAARWNQEMYSEVPDGAGEQTHWGRDAWRADAALGYRPTAHTQVKLQYSFERESIALRAHSHLVAAQFTLRF